MRVLVLGASGFVGKHLTAALRARGDEIEESSLRDPVAAAAAARSCDAVVNLAGESLAQRWNAAVKDRIESSRTQLPRRFLEALASNQRRPAVYVSASAIGYYGTSETTIFDEESPPGDDFLARVCRRWESEAFRARDLGMRVAVVRSGLVLDPEGGALAKTLPPFRMGLGGTIGNGRQWISWIHRADAVAIYALALDRAAGAIDASAPNPVTNEEFTRTLATVLKKPAVAPVPTLALRALLGEGATMLLTGQRVLPKRVTEEYGYRFAFPELESALRNLLDRHAEL